MAAFRCCWRPRRAIESAYLKDEHDRAVMIAGLRRVRQIASHKPLADFIVEETDPAPACDSDEQILDYLQQTGLTVYHPVGSCRMGDDDTAVVDARLRFRGLAGLRIADASIMPTLVATNTNAASIMIGERAAAWALRDAANRCSSQNFDPVISLRLRNGHKKAHRRRTELARPGLTRGTIR